MLKKVDVNEGLGLSIPPEVESPDFTTFEPANKDANEYTITGPMSQVKDIGPKGMSHPREGKGMGKKSPAPTGGGY